MLQLPTSILSRLDAYQQHIYAELLLWQRKQDRSPSIFNHLTSGVQKKINKIIPEKVHKAITATVREMIKALMVGTKFIAPKPAAFAHIHEAETAVDKRIKNHKHTAALEGGLTGAGGFLWSLADFPLLLGIKIKLLQDIAALYGYDGNDVKEKFFMLMILQNAFSSDKVRRDTYYQILNFESHKEQLPTTIQEADWLTLQQQYRDYLDIAKLLQMMPIIGAAVGTIVNYRLLNKLGHTAMQCYRIRYFQQLQR